jgi:hypothetical protein
MPAVLQLPAVATQDAASALLVERAPTNAKVKAKIPTERKTFFKLNFIFLYPNIVGQANNNFRLRRISLWLK